MADVNDPSSHGRSARQWVYCRMRDDVKTGVDYYGRKRARTQSLSSLISAHVRHR